MLKMTINNFETYVRKIGPESMKDFMVYLNLSNCYFSLCFEHSSSCDYCEKDVGLLYYDCKTCPDFDCCSECFVNNDHEHTLEEAELSEQRKVYLQRFQDYCVEGLKTNQNMVGEEVDLFSFLSSETVGVRTQAEDVLSRLALFPYFARLLLPKYLPELESLNFTYFRVLFMFRVACIPDLKHNMAKFENAIAVLEIDPADERLQDISQAFLDQLHT
jgi:hypothetical protein